MSKNSRGNRNYWQSAARNSESYRMYYNWILSLALTRFKWINLPETCDERFLEFTLLTQGMATIATPRDGKFSGFFYSTQVCANGTPNVYDTPRSWYSYGNNGWHFECDNNNGVLIYENLQRMPIIPTISLYAQRLAEMDRTLEINLNAQKSPFIFTCSQQQQQDLVNLMKNVLGGEPAILGTKNMNDLVNSIQVLNTQVPFIGEQIQSAQQTMWAQIYNFLGIKSLPRKTERMIQDEVSSVNMPTELRALDGLTARRAACDKLNARFGAYLDAPISVVWREDNESANYNLFNNFKRLSEVEENDAPAF